MSEEVKNLLTRLGVASQTITDLADAEKAKAIKVDEVVTTTLGTIRNRLRNDDGFVSEIEKGLRASILGAKERKLLKAFEFLNLKDEDLSRLPEEKKFDSLIELLGERAATLKKDPGKSDEKDEEIRKLNDQIRILRDERKKILEEDIPGIRQEVARERKQVRIETAARKELAKHKLVIDPDFAFTSIFANIRERHDIDLADDGKIRILQKGKDLEAFGDNQQPLTLSGLIEESVKAANLVKQSKAGEGDPTRRTGRGEEDPEGSSGSRKSGVNLPGLEAAQQRAAEMKGEKAKA